MTRIHNLKLIKHWSIFPLMIFFSAILLLNYIFFSSTPSLLAFLVPFYSWGSGSNVVAVSNRFYNFCLIFHLPFTTMDLSKNEGSNKPQLQLLTHPQVEASMFLKLAYILVLNLQMKELNWQLMWLCDFWTLRIFLLRSSIFPSKGWHHLWKLDISNC